MNNADVLRQIIQTRRSTFPKSYSGKTLSDAVIQEILDSATYAPQHKKTKPLRLKVFKGDEKLRLGQELQNIYRETSTPQTFLQKKFDDILNKIETAAAIVTISVNFSELVPAWEEIASVAMSVQNMYLTATVLEAGCYWSSPALVQHLGGFLELTESQKCYGLFYLGDLSD